MDDDAYRETEDSLRQYGADMAVGLMVNQWGDLDADDAPERVLWDFGVTVDPDEVGHGARLVTPDEAQHLFGVFYTAAHS